MARQRLIAFDLAAVAFALAANAADAAGAGLLAWLTLLPAIAVFVVADRCLKTP